VQDQLLPAGFSHGDLDLAGWAPLVGDYADAANTVWYLKEGDYGNAALQSIAILPLLGQPLKHGAKWVVDKLGGLFRHVDDIPISLPSKITTQMESRGWTPEMINDTVRGPSETHPV
jgi:hypothetical protein